MKKSGRQTSLILIFIFSGLFLYGQSRQDLEKQRMSILKKIENTSNILEKTKKNKKSTIADYKIIERQIENRKSLIENIKNEIDVAGQTIQINRQKLDSLQVKLEELNKQYADLQRLNYLKKLSGNKWAYFLSSVSLNDAFLRWRYMKQFENFCKVKTSEIKDLTQDIQKYTDKTEEEITLRKQLFEKESKQFSILEGEKKEKSRIINSLEKEEKRFRKELARQQEEREKLNKAIENIIVRELSLTNAETEADLPSKKTPDITLEADFFKNKGRLPWPVDKGVISTRFGDQPHPTIKNLKISSNGIDITTSINASVFSVFSGKVIGVTAIPGYDNMIIIQHGKFYSVYSKLDKVFVNKGDIVNTGQKIGSLAPTENNTSTLHFELWKNKVKNDPEQWLRK